MAGAPTRIAGKRGLLPFRRHSIKLMFGDYVVRDKLPVLPKSFGHIGNNPDGPQAGMLSNDRAGCCVASGAAHETRLFAHATGRPMPSFANSTLANYSNMMVAQGNPAYNPHDDSTDSGLDVELAAKYRRDVGILDDGGLVHKIAAYAVISDAEELKMAVYCFGVCGLGLNLPQSSGHQFEAGHIWDDLSSVPDSGHYPPCFGVNGAGNFVLSTWGSIQAATPAYIERYWSVAVAYLSHEYMRANGRSPELIDWAGLQQDLDTVTTL